ncbi:hypothetical protein Leryth_007808 [Lithospermum erythrorhizon]|nr:hypothetical protein Leryth_007808 [Lithospermum erythrorhizon]
MKGKGKENEDSNHNVNLYAVGLHSYKSTIGRCLYKGASFITVFQYSVQDELLSSSSIWGG